MFRRCQNRREYREPSGSAAGEPQNKGRETDHSDGNRANFSPSPDIVLGCTLAAARSLLYDADVFGDVWSARKAEGPAHMLVVTRKKDEKLIIGNEIEIQVLRIGRDNVRLGIKAPSHISIYRYEIYEAIKQENVNAVQSQIPDKSMMESLKGVFRVESKEE